MRCWHGVCIIASFMPFLMRPSYEPCDPWEIQIESPTIDDGTNPYYETPDVSDLMPVIFPGGGGGASGGGSASGDWFATPISGDGMLSEIATFAGYASPWTWERVNGVMVATRERFLGSCTISRVGGGAWIEEVEHRRGFDEPLKRLTIKGVDGESGYYLERYVFDGGHCGRTSIAQDSYPIYDYNAPTHIRDVGEYGLTRWLWDREKHTQQMPAEGWIEYRCPTFTVKVPNRTVSTYPYKEEHRNILAHCDSDELWHVWNNRQYDIYAAYDIYVDDVYVRHEISPYAYTSYLYDYPADVLSQEVQRQHYPKIGTERVTLNYRPSDLPVILGGSLPSYLILIAIVLLCAVSNNSVTSSVGSDAKKEEQIRRYM